MAGPGFEKAWTDARFNGLNPMMGKGIQEGDSHVSASSDVCKSMF